MPLYRILSRQWDGERLHPKGAVLEFPEGKEPPGATLEEEPKGKAKKPSLLDD